jgi:outer membrane protein
MLNQVQHDGNCGVQSQPALISRNEICVPHVIPRMMRNLPPSLAALFLAATAVAVPSHAQDVAAPPPRSIFDGDYLTVGAGAAVGPSYEGSDDYVFFPAVAAQGRIGGIGIAPRPAGIALDLISEPRDAKFAFQLGPVARARFDRNKQIEDPVVAALGKRDVAVEVGGNAGFSINRIANPYDSLTFSLDARWDVAKAHRGMVIAPNATYQTPLSKGIFLAASLSAERVDDDYARHYFSITPGGSLASGLPAYDAHGGWKTVGLGLLGGIDLDGDLTNGGFALFTGVIYSRLLGNFKRSPIVSVRGSADQFAGAIGIGYTF